MYETVICYHTCGRWVGIGEILVALQFDLIEDVHLLLRRERTIKPLQSKTNKIKSVSMCQFKLENIITYFTSCVQDGMCGNRADGNCISKRCKEQEKEVVSQFLAIWYFVLIKKKKRKNWQKTVITRFSTPKHFCRSSSRTCDLTRRQGF